jgi:hypothetical protein
MALPIELAYHEKLFDGLKGQSPGQLCSNIGKIRHFHLQNARLKNSRLEGPDGYHGILRSELMATDLTTVITIPRGALA